MPAATSRSILLWLPICLFALACLVFRIDFGTADDALYLLHAAQEVLSGHAMTQAYFDTNPPMSFLVYIPAALIENTGIPAWHALNLYTLGLLALSLFLSWTLLRTTNCISLAARALFLGGTYFALSAGCLLSFGLKDHLIAIMLIPFVLAQIHLLECKGTARPSESKCAWIACALSMPFILLKPHYGLLPVALLALRFWKRRSLSILREADFICLTMGTLIYAALLLWKFPDFFTTALPAILDLYVSQPPQENPVFKQSAAAALFITCLAAFAWFSPAKTDDQDRTFCFLVCGLSLLALFPYALQGMGFVMHTLPLQALATGAVLLSAQLHIPWLRSLNTRSLSMNAGFLIAFWLCFLQPQFGTRDDFVRSPLAQLLKSRAQNNGFIAETGTTTPFWQIAEYTGVPVGSRFPSLWFLGGLVTREEHADQRPYSALFAQLLAEDIETRKPDLLLFLPAEDGGAVLNILATQPPLAAALKHYKPSSLLDFDYTDYGRFRSYNGYGTTRFRIYERTG